MRTPLLVTVLLLAACSDKTPPSGDAPSDPAGQASATPTSPSVQPPTTAPVVKPVTSPGTETPPGASAPVGEPGRTVAVVLGTPITYDQIDIGEATRNALARASGPAAEEAQRRIRKLTMQRLTSRIIRPLTEREIERNGFAATDEEIDAVLAWGRLNLQKRLDEARRELESPETTPERRKQLEAQIVYNERELQKAYDTPLADQPEQERERFAFAIEVARTSVERWRLQKFLHEAYGGRIVVARVGPPQPLAPDAMQAWLADCVERGDLVFTDEQTRQDFLAYQVTDDPKHREAPADYFAVPWWGVAP